MGVRQPRQPGVDKGVPVGRRPAAGCGHRCFRPPPHSHARGRLPRRSSWEAPPRRSRRPIISGGPALPPPPTSPPSPPPRSPFFASPNQLCAGRLHPGVPAGRWHQHRVRPTRLPHTRVHRLPHRPLQADGVGRRGGCRALQRKHGERPPWGSPFAIAAHPSMRVSSQPAAICTTQHATAPLAMMLLLAAQPCTPFHTHLRAACVLSPVTAALLPPPPPRPHPASLDPHLQASSNAMLLVLIPCVVGGPLVLLLLVWFVCRLHVGRTAKIACEPFTAAAAALQQQARTSPGQGEAAAAPAVARPPSARAPVPSVSAV